MVVADDDPESLALTRAMFGAVDGVVPVGMAADGRQAVDLVESGPRSSSPVKVTLGAKPNRPAA